MLARDFSVQFTSSSVHSGTLGFRVWEYRGLGFRV